MKLSEAISLGHTLIGENRAVFYSDCNVIGEPTPPCGCAIGSAAAALGEATYLVDESWCERKWPWTAAPATDFPSLIRAGGGAYQNGDTVAGLISGMHIYGMPRLEIAKLIAQIEPDEELAEEVQGHGELTVEELRA